MNLTLQHLRGSAGRGDHTTGTRKGKFDVNITPGERIGRIIIGLVGALGGVALLVSSPTRLAGSLEVLLILAGLDLIVTGAIGHCPLYKMLGYIPASLRRNS
jgi:hypothetical protein